MVSLLLSAFIAQTQPAEAPAAEHRVVPDEEIIEIFGVTPKPDVTILVTMVEPKLDEEIELQASFVDKIPQSLD